jgi:hypothetical protein
MLELLINGKQADIKDTSIIAVTKTYENVSNPLNYYADYSKTIKLPISRRNNDIFNNFNRLDNIVTNVTLDPTKKIPFILLNNQEPVMEGYLKLENANTIFTDECYEVTLFSSFGLLMNDLKLLTFNPNAQDIDEKYIIDSPFSNNLVVDRNLVKQSFAQGSHNINGNAVTDWIGFIPTYQGKYADFSSDREQLLPYGRTDDMTRERDEHYKREFRSYYQQPFIWVDKLWKVAKDKIDEITDYTMVLDTSWFIASNPYYRDLIYTCPSLYNSGTSSFAEENQVFSSKLNELAVHQYGRNSNSRLDTHRTFWFNNLTSTSGTIYDENGIFNANSDKGSTTFKANFNFTFFAYSGVPDGLYAKITDDSPFYLKFKAVNANTNQEIFGANKTYLIYSDDNDANSCTYDEAVDLGISERGDFPSTMSQRTPAYTSSNGFVWEHTLNVELNVTENVPYKVGVEIWCLNNEKPFEWINSSPTFTPTWDWVWTDFFVAENGKGYSMWFDTLSASVTTVENMRTNSSISLYKIFPKETTLADVLLNYSKMFGLVWKIDESEKTITVMTRNRFFENYHIEDWSDKIDRSKEFKFNPLTFDKRYVEFNFDEGECHRLKQYDDFYQLTYGTKKLDSGYEFNADTNKLFEKLTPSVISQKRQFSKMMNTEFEDRPNFRGYSYMVYPNEHFVDNDNNGDSAGMSGAFYFKNGTFNPDPQLSNWDNQGNYIFVISDDTEHMIKTGEYCWNSCGENMTIAYKFPDISTISNKYGDYNFSIHFEAPKEYYFDSSGIGEVKYIYDTFWRDYIDERYCSQNKKLTAYVYLTIEEFRKLDFTEFIKIDNILYHIDKIADFNFNSNNPVKIDLVQVWNLNAYLGSEPPFPYLYTDYTSYVLSNNAISVPVHASGEWSVFAVGGIWLQATKSGDNLLLQCTSTTQFARSATVILKLQGEWLGWAINVTQVDANGRLNVTPETLVFDDMGGTQEVLIDASDTTNGAITITTSASWLSATITDYYDFMPATVPEFARRNYLHMNVTANPCMTARNRNATVNLSMDYQGTTYTAVVHVGQQLGTYHRMDIEDGVITDRDDFDVYDGQHNRVNNLLAGEQYTFDDYFPEEIDVNSIEISNGLVNITGASGMQTVTFTPQLSDGNEVGGGVITATTLNGNRISYPYNVTRTTPAPNKRRIIVRSDSKLGAFRISTSGLDSKTTDYFEMDFNDGTVINIVAVPNAGYTLDKWVRNGSVDYTTPQLTLTIGSGLVGQDGIIAVELRMKEAQKTVTVTLISPSDGYITIGNDTTHYTNVTRTVVEGTALTNVKATANSELRPFKNWSDGSTINPRDIIVNKDTTISAVYGGQLVSQSMIYLDGGGLIGGNDTVTVRFDGSDVLKCGVGQQDSKKVSEATYRLDLICDINDLASKFNNFTVGSNNYYTNPYTNASFNLSDDTTFGVKTIPSALYYANENLFDTIKDTDQSVLIGGQFHDAALDIEVKVETNYEAELTAAIPTDYKIKGILDADGQDVMEEKFTIVQTANGYWWDIYTDRSSETESYLFMLELV